MKLRVSVVRSYLGQFEAKQSPMNICRLSFRFIAYAWAAPNTLLGLAVGLVMLCLGGQLRFVAGVSEFHGGWLGRIVARAPKSVGFGAMTLGHTIVGVNQVTLRVLRAHEHAHVRQYEQWGLFFLPAYVLSSLWQVINGRNAHASNFFERQACAMASEAPSGQQIVENPPNTT